MYHATFCVRKKKKLKNIYNLYYISYIITYVICRFVFHMIIKRSTRKTNHRLNKMAAYQVDGVGGGHRDTVSVL